MKKDGGRKRESKKVKQERYINEKMENKGKEVFCEKDIRSKRTRMNRFRLI